MIKSNTDLKIPVKILNSSEWVKCNLNIGIGENILTYFSKKTLSKEIYFLTEVKLDHTKIPKKFNSDKGQNWDFSKLNTFQLYIDDLTNLISFLLKNDIYFLTEMKIDYSKIPEALHGNGDSKNLLQYFSNNKDDKELIFNFLNYFVSQLNIRNINDEKIDFSFIKSGSWNNSIDDSSFFWNWQSSKWVKFTINKNKYQNIIEFLNDNDIYFLAQMDIDYSKVPIGIKSHNKNLLEYITNPKNSHQMIMEFLNYFLIVLLDVRNYNNKLKFRFSESTSWKNSEFEIFDEMNKMEDTTTTTTTTIFVGKSKVKEIIHEEKREYITTTTTSTTTTTTTTIRGNTIYLKFNAFTNQNICESLESKYSILEDDFEYASAIYYYNSESFAQNGYYSDGLYWREWNGLNLSQPVQCDPNMIIIKTTSTTTTSTTTIDIEEITVPTSTTTSTTSSTTTSSTTKLIPRKSVKLKFNAFTSQNSCNSLEYDYTIAGDDFESAISIYYFNSTSLAQNGFYSDGIYWREWNGLTLSESVLCK